MNRLLSIILIVCASFSAVANDYVEKGIECRIDGRYHEAFKFFEKAYNLGDRGVAAAELAELYYEGLGCEQDFVKSHNLHLIASNNGYAYSLYVVGQNYFNGLGCEQDLKKALGFYKLAADKGIADGALNYAAMKYKGIGCDVDLKESQKYYMIAAANLQPIALYCIGKTYFYGKYNGFELPMDRNMSYKLLKKSAELGFEPAAVAIRELFGSK